MTTLQTFTGPVKLCTLWDFMKEVRVEYVPQISEQIALARKNFFEDRRFRYTPESPQMEAYYQSRHLLKLNPSSVLVELKKTTQMKYRTSKELLIEDLINELATESHTLFGNPSHFFPIGKDKYALVSIDDVKLYVKKDWKQSLVCMDPKRNFQIYAPRLKV